MENIKAKKKENNKKKSRREIKIKKTICRKILKSFKDVNKKRSSCKNGEWGGGDACLSCGLLFNKQKIKYN